MVSTTQVACPYCGREPMPYARFCDRCGNDLSTFWRSMHPLVRQGYEQQWSQNGTPPSLNDAVQDLKTWARRWGLLPKPSNDQGQSKTSAARPSARIRELEATRAEVENLRKERDKLTERTREVEAKLATLVPVTLSCYAHPDRGATNTCGICSRRICRQCSNWAAEDVYVCSECWQSQRQRKT